MTITFNGSDNHQTTPTNTQAHTEHPETTAARILVELSSSSTSPPAGTPPLGDPSPLYHFTESNRHLSVSDICSNRAGLSEGVIEFLETPVDIRVEILLKTVTQLIATTPPLRRKIRFATRQPKQTGPSLASRISRYNQPPPQQQQPRPRSYRDAVNTRPKPILKTTAPLARQLIPLNQPRPATQPRPGPPPIPHHSRPAPAGSPPKGFDSLTRQQLIDLLREVLKIDPLAFGTPQTSTFRTTRRRAFRTKTLNSASNPLNSASDLLPLHHRRPLAPQSHVFSQAHPRRQRPLQSQRSRRR